MSILAVPPILGTTINNNDTGCSFYGWKGLTKALKDDFQLASPLVTSRQVQRDIHHSLQEMNTDRFRYSAAQCWKAFVYDLL